MSILRVPKWQADERTPRSRLEIATPETTQVTGEQALVTHGLSHGTFFAVNK
jgi:hypothetical protein